MDAQGSISAFEERFYDGRHNRFVGSGGEVLLKEDPTAPRGRMDVGDRLIGIGVTHLVEDLDSPPGPDAFWTTTSPVQPTKTAARSFRVTAKEQSEGGYDFRFEPLPAAEYAATLADVSDGLVEVDPASIPEGTIILSFINDESSYTLREVEGSPGANWASALAGARHWNVGFGNDDDFWSASFPSDEIHLLRDLSPAVEIGSISFGLSLLPGSQTTVKLETVPSAHPSGKTTMHHFSLNGRAAGTRDLATPFPIGLRTAIVFRPLLS